MGLWNRIGGWWPDSHPVKFMFNQQAFNRNAALHPWAVHFGALFFGLIILFWLNAVIVATPKYLSHRHLLHDGAQASGTIDHNSVRPYKSGKSSTQKYEITVRYHFTAQDGRRYDGISKVDTVQQAFVYNGMHIEVPYARDNPRDNGWRMALDQAIDEFFLALALTPLICGWLGLFSYRYLRWRRSCAETNTHFVQPSGGVVS